MRLRAGSHKSCDRYKANMNRFLLTIGILTTCCTSTFAQNIGDVFAEIRRVRAERSARAKDSGGTEFVIESTILDLTKIGVQQVRLKTRSMSRTDYGSDSYLTSAEQLGGPVRQDNYLYCVRSLSLVDSVGGQAFPPPPVVEPGLLVPH